MALVVVEVIERSSQGRTEPYICRCDDGEVYFVKGRSATRQGLLNEWLCANLASSFGLPIPPFAIATVPEELLASDFDGWLRGLGAGPVFASKRVVAAELTHSQVSQVPEDQRRDVLVFDWWVRNADRCLTENGGNVNLLWAPGSSDLPAPAQGGGGLVVIDHNLAFDADFSSEIFCETHVFARDLGATFSDFVLRETYVARLAQALATWPSVCEEVPPAWQFVDEERTLPLRYPLDDLRATLSRHRTAEFWILPS